MDYEDNLKQIEKFLDEWEEENNSRRKNLEKSMKDAGDYYKEGIKIQKEYRENVSKIIKIKNVRDCEKLIEDISKTIPSHIIMGEALPIMEELTSDVSSKMQKKIKSDLKKYKETQKLLPKELADRVEQLSVEEKDLLELMDKNMAFLVEGIGPLMMLSRDKWSFLWNLANWKLNTLLAKQMNRYTLAVVVLTVAVVIFAFIQLWL